MVEKERENEEEGKNSNLEIFGKIGKIESVFQFLFFEKIYSIPTETTLE